MKCFLCRRGLKNPTSLQRGYGDECGLKYQQYLAACDATDEEIAGLERLENPIIARRLHGFRLALGRGKMRDAMQLLNAARREARRTEADAAGLVEEEFWKHVNTCVSAKGNVWGGPFSQLEGSGKEGSLPLFPR